MNNVIKGYQPFCAGCDNIQFDGKLPLHCDNCPRMMEMQTEEQKNIDKAVEKLLKVIDEYSNERDSVVEMYNNLMEDRNKIMAEKKACMKRRLELLIKYKKLVKEKKNE